MSFFHAGPAPKAQGPRPGALRDGLDLQPGMAVGLFGGSFNPAHDGHAHVAETAMRRLGLDRVVWLVSPQNPLKDARDSAPLAERMASARAAARLAADGRAMVVSDFETRAGTQWTVDTLRALTARHPGVRFVWLMGSDNLASFHKWRGWTDIMRMMPMAVIARPGSQLDSRTAPAAARFASARVPAARARLLPDLDAPAWTYLTAPLNPRSSTALRAARDAAAHL
ncbi:MULTISPECIES: nicotinate-nucleotide adenylyltransferase [unclassified Brevundimonas]|uniref:nicotinate-nucleotide adenylyltransferase n=1 Tax=unclassified Brevundimonas TaxID=2622653 RepID=UPI0006F2287F|nr:MULTISPECIES: nicotinate-nucleotide adenylyltransferase [unclassified Brevundimonas]KQY79288.1 nicotinate-nicotinamide nucleotide adenylyltransferase [Brevundimonas sp. Root1423]KRA21993.1 nicotinate-nicotinamide nucleotide adenylyltransferase [Brevundimonas sp. Root608]